MLSLMEIQKILETINEHTENEKINERFKDILTELNKSTLPRCKNDTTRYLGIEEINTEIFISKTSPSSQTKSTLNENPNTQIIAFKPKTYLSLKPKFLTEYQKNVLGKAFVTLKSYRFTREMLREFILNGGEALNYLMRKPCLSLSPKRLYCKFKA